MLEYIPPGISALRNIAGFSIPYKLTFAVTYNCNSRCTFCSIWKRKPEGELETEEIQKIGEKAGFIKWLNITGGEPFLRKDLPEIVRSFKKISLLNFTTNGIMKNVPDVLGEIREKFHGKIVLSVSLDGPPEIHDRLRGVPGNWKRAVELMRKIREMGIESYFGFTIGPGNSGEFESTVESVRKFGFSESDFHINIYHTSEYYGNSRRKGWERDAIEISEKMAKIKKASGLLGMVEYAYLSRVRKFLESGKTPIPCTALKSSVFLDPMGNVFPCTMWGRKLGNVRDSGYSLLEILKSEKSRKTRRMISEGNCPNCWTPCEAFPSIIGKPLSLIS